MKYLPFEPLTYRTTLSPTESVQHLQDHVEPQKTFRMNGFWRKKPHKDYEGYLSANGSIIHVKMQP